MYCTQPTERGTCRIHEIDGMGFCLQHVPDDMLDEAEAVTRTRRCRMRFGQPVLPKLGERVSDYLDACDQFTHTASDVLHTR